MTALNIKKIIYSYLLDNMILDRTLKIHYITGTGCGDFIINDLWQFFPVAPGKMKIIIDIIRKSNNPQEPAEALHNYLKGCADYLTTIRDKSAEQAYNDTEKSNTAQLTNEIKRYIANIDALSAAFKLEAVTDKNAVKMSKQEVLTLKYDPAGRAYKAENHTGKRFIKGGVVFHVYKVNRLTYIIIPCAGLPVVTYEGAINAAPEYITPELLEKIKSWNFLEPNARLLDVIKNAENIILNNDIYLTEPEPAEEVTNAAPDQIIQKDTAPAPKTEPAASPENDTPAPAEVAPAIIDTAKQAPPVYIALVYYGYIAAARRKTGINGRYNNNRVKAEASPENVQNGPQGALFNTGRRATITRYNTAHRAALEYINAGYYIRHARGCLKTCKKLYFDTS